MARFLQEGWKIQLGDEGTHMEMSERGSGGGANQLRTPTFWPSAITLNHYTRAEKLPFKRELKWKQRITPLFTQSGCYLQNFQTPLGEQMYEYVVWRSWLGLGRIRLRQQAGQLVSRLRCFCVCTKMECEVSGKPARSKLPITGWVRSWGPNKWCFVGLQFSLYSAIFCGSTSEVPQSFCSPL